MWNAFPEQSLVTVPDTIGLDRIDGQVIHATIGAAAAALQSGAMLPGQQGGAPVDIGM